MTWYLWWSEREWGHIACGRCAFGGVYVPCFYSQARWITAGDSSLLYSCDVFRAVINALVCWYLVMINWWRWWWWGGGGGRRGGKGAKGGRWCWCLQWQLPVLVTIIITLMDNNHHCLIHFTGFVKAQITMRSYRVLTTSAEPVKHSIVHSTNNSRKWVSPHHRSQINTTVTLNPRHNSSAAKPAAHWLIRD